jgi:glucoselysine-6-phosphate deglycase
MLFLELSKEDSEKWISKILGTIDLIPDIAKATKQWYESEKDELKRFKNIIVIGYDKCLPAATEGALKILETVQCCVRYYELEEFMHGIYHGIDKSTLILALGNQSRHLNRMVRLLGYLKEHKNATTYLISQNKVTKHDFSYPFIEDSLFGSFEYLTVLQVLGELMCHDRGIDLYDTADENFHEYMESYVYEK